MQFPFLQRAGKNQFTSVSVNPEGVCIASIENASQPILRICDFVPWQAKEATDKILQVKARQYGLSNLTCGTIMNLGDYSVLSMEAPDVPQNELKAAVRWQIKDLIDFHVDDAVLDVYDMPASGADRKHHNIYVVVSKLSFVKQQVNVLQNAKVNLTTVDIPELALRNITSQLPQDAQGVVFVYLAANRGLVVLTRQSELFIARNIDMGLNHLDSEQANHQLPEHNPAFDKLVLEVQRTLDYYDRYFVQPPVSNIIMSSTGGNLDIVNYLFQSIGIDVSVLDINAIVDVSADIDTFPISESLLTIGAALRKEKKRL